MHRVLLFTVVARALGAAFSLVMVIVLGHRLGASATGLVLLAWTCCQYIAATSRCGSHVLLLRVGSRAFAAGRVALVRGVTLQAACVTLGGAVVVALAVLATRRVSAGVITNLLAGENVIGAFATMLPSLALGYILVDVLKAVGRTEIASFVQTGSIPCVVVLAVLAFGLDSPVSVAWAFAAGSATSSAAIGVLAALHLGGMRPREFVSARVLVRSSSQVFAFESATLALQWLPLVVVAVVLGDRDVGILLSAGRLSAVVNVLVIGIMNVLSPEFARIGGSADEGRIGTSLRIMSGAVTLLSVILLPVLLIVAPSLMQMLGDEFASDGSVLVLLVLSQLIAASMAGSGHALAMLGHERNLAINGVVSLLLAMPITAWLSVQFGIAGAAGAIAVSSLVQGLLNARSVERLLGESSWPSVAELRAGLVRRAT